MTSVRIRIVSPTVTCCLSRGRELHQPPAEAGDARLTTASEAIRPAANRRWRMATPCWSAHRTLIAAPRIDGKKGLLVISEQAPEGTTAAEEISRAELALATRNAG